MTRATTAALMAASLMADCKPRASVDRAQTDARNESLFATQLSLQDGEAVGLLSAKYELDAAIVRNLINDYRREYDLLYATTDTTRVLDDSRVDNILNPRATGVMSTVAALAAAHGVSQQKVASLLWDYRLLKSVERAGTVE